MFQKKNLVKSKDPLTLDQDLQKIVHQNVQRNMIGVHGEERKGWDNKSPH